MLGEALLRARLGFPRGTLTVPIMIEGATALRESFDIARYGERLGEGAKLFPEGREAEVAQWNGLSDVIGRAGRALLTPRLARSEAALEESTPRSVPRALRAIAAPGVRAAIAYLAHKYEVREEEAEQDRETIRFALRKLRAQLERSDHVLGPFSYADVAVIAALQMVRPCETLAKLGPATAAAWTDETLAREHEDVLSWRDRTVASHFVRRTKK